MHRVRIGHLPQEADDSGWFAALGERPSARALEGTRHSDWLVVGGGWMGLHAAHRLAELRPDERIALVDAGRIGNNAAGRCAGYAIDVAPRPGRRYTDADVQRDRDEIRVSREGLDYLRTCVERHGIRCDWSERGKIHAAASRAGQRKLAALAQALERLGEDHERLDARAMRAATGTDFYAAGVRTPGTVLLQPAACLAGLVASLGPNVAVYEDSPVVEIDYGEDAHRVRTPRGEVIAPRVLLATNAFLSQFGFYARHTIPVYTYASLTRPLSAQELRAAGDPPEFGVVPAERFGTTLRRTADNRLFVRNVFAHAPRFRSPASGRARARRCHARALARRYPRIASIGFEHTWGGLLCLSANGGMAFGRMANGVHATAFCNGIGVARGAAFGKALAEHAAGARSRTVDSLLQRAEPARTWPAPIMRAGVPLVTAWRLFRARNEI